jgi:hypothetical protein
LNCLIDLYSITNHQKRQENLMKYMLLIYSDENCWADGEREACMQESGRVCDELAAQGKLLDASPLELVSSATSLRIRDGRQITDGPFAETTEQLGGFYLIDVETREEAHEIASRLPPAKKGTVEIRPLYPLPAREADARPASEAVAH